MKEIKCPRCGNVITVDDADFAALLSQVRTDEFEKELSRRVSEMLKVHTAEEAARAAREAARQQALVAGKDREIERLKQQIAGWDEKKDLEIENIRHQAREAAAGELRKKETELLKKGEEINSLIARASRDKELAAERMQNLLDAHKKEVENLEKEVEVYKNFKAKRSVKLLGEDLEQHCYALYNQLLLPVMPESSFEKDNAAVKEDGEGKGTKGDFIFRGRENGTEYLSIMFEMKNEADASATRHKNSDFFEKLDKDRRKKDCEFAVLVSMLEMDNDLYNNGITVVPGYDKMYVVRPDNFISIITLLVQTSKKSLESKMELEAARRQSTDVTGFENAVNRFKDDFTKSVSYAKERYDEAIKGIDATIKKLEAIKESLRISSGHLIAANNKAEDLSIKKLTKDNPTMKKAFEDARAREQEARKLQEPDEQ